MSTCSSEDDDQEVSDFPLPAWLEGDSLAPPCQADKEVVKAIIDFAGVTADDVLYDLGCGDGRICIEAAESRGARACGVEIEDDLARKFRRRVAARGLESKVSVVHGDLRDVDLSDATVVITYLLPKAMEDLAESHLLPLLRRGVCRDAGTISDTGSISIGGFTEGTIKSGGGQRPVVGSSKGVGKNGDIKSDCDDGATGDFDDGHGNETKRNREESGHQEAPLISVISGISSRGNGNRDGRRERPCRIVCNTWGIPGAVPVKEAGVGMYGGVKLRLFTCESLPT